MCVAFPANPVPTVRNLDTTGPMCPPRIPPHMLRGPRIDFPGARHHVMNRGARRAAVFADDATRQMFLDHLAALLNRRGVVIHAYALMSNHFHLLIETPQANLSKAMQTLQGGFSQQLNLNIGGMGPCSRAASGTGWPATSATGRICWPICTSIPSKQESLRMWSNPNGPATRPTLTPSHAHHGSQPQSCSTCMVA
jgi:REP element-mobilizing transposase RayT